MTNDEKRGQSVHFTFSPFSFHILQDTARFFAVPLPSHLGNARRAWAAARQ